MVALWSQLGKLCLGDKLERKARRRRCHPFVTKERDGSGWGLGKSDPFLLPRL